MITHSDKFLDHDTCTSQWPSDRFYGPRTCPPVSIDPEHPFSAPTVPSAARYTHHSTEEEPCPNARP